MTPFLHMRLLSSEKRNPIIKEISFRCFMNIFRKIGNQLMRINAERGIKMKHKKHILALMSMILSAGFLFGCNGVDEDEPDPSEEPSEQREDNAQ